MIASGRLRIAQVNTADAPGGAERVALGLHRAYNAAGHDAWLVVGRKLTSEAGVLALRHEKSQDALARIGRGPSRLLAPFDGRVRGVRRVRGYLEGGAAGIRHHWNDWAGRDQFDFPESAALLDLFDPPPDVLHCHNLHGDFFDLRALPSFSALLPVVLTLHDAWLFSGHCAHSIECERWRTGCGKCPDLTLYPSIRRDATRYNWRRKREIFMRSRVFLTAPSQWLIDRASESILAAAVLGTRVIPNGVDLRHFTPTQNRCAVRAELRIAPDTTVLAFAANGIRSNPWKDFRTLRAAVERVAGTWAGGRLLFLAIGETGDSERIGDAEIRFVPFERDPSRLARYYQAADLYVHAAKAETFGLTILEALACGTPVVATAVGGIPETIKDIDSSAADEATGVLVPPGDSVAFASAIGRLISDTSLRERVGRQALADVRHRFSLDGQIASYLRLYGELLSA